MKRAILLFALCLTMVGCGDSDATSGDSGQGGSGGSVDSGTAGDSSGDAGGSLVDGGTGGAFPILDGGDFDSPVPTTVEMFPELWYCVDRLLIRIALDSVDGAVQGIQASDITTDLDLGQSAITMMDDGSLLISRLSRTDNQSHLYHVAEPPRDGSDVTPASLGVMPDGIMLEGLYTDCEGRTYGMDTGADDSSATGNRLLRFTGDVTAGDFAFVVVSDLATADVADIDDMGPGIENNEITDNPGLAIDTGHIYAFNFETGSGTQIAQAGTFGIHALGGSLFNDGISRLYVLNDNADLFEVDPQNYSVSSVLGTGPTPNEGTPGWSSLAGPLTDCETGFTPPPR